MCIAGYCLHFRFKGKQFICDVLGDEVKAQVTKKIKEKRLKWYAHGKAMNEGHVLRRMLDLCTRTRNETARKTGIQMEMFV